MLLARCFYRSFVSLQSATGVINYSRPTVANYWFCCCNFSFIKFIVRFIVPAKSYIKQVAIYYSKSSKWTRRHRFSSGFLTLPFNALETICVGHCVSITSRYAAFGGMYLDIILYSLTQYGNAIIVLKTPLSVPNRRILIVTCFL